MPDVPGPDDLPDLVRPPEMPEFTARYDIRWVAGGGIGRPGRRARNLAWARPRPAAPLDAVTVASLADTLVPAAFSRLGRFAIVPTMDLTIHFRAPLPAEGEWLLCSFSSLLADGGVWEEDGEVWSQDGRLLAQSRQLAIIREPR
jgi:acyl-CoA thioesterase